MQNTRANPSREPSVPRFLSLAALAISAVVLISALMGSVFAATREPPNWFVLGFELLVVIAGVFGVLFGLGRFRDGPAVCLLCVAGAIGACSLLAYQTAQQIPGSLAQGWLVGRALAAAALAVLAGLSVICRAPGKAMPDLIKGGIAAGLFVGSAAGLWLARGAIASLEGWLQFTLWVVAAIWLLVLLAPATQWLIRAFARPLESDGVGPSRA